VDTISRRPVAARANFIAESTISAPVEPKNTASSDRGSRAVSASASIPASGEYWICTPSSSSASSVALIVSRMSGWLWPRLANPSPLWKSRYSRPLTS
jgi:hypothetical protein